MAVEARWVDLEAMPVVFVNQAVGQVTQGEIVVTFGRVVPPPLPGTSEEQRRQMASVPFLPIVPVVRLTTTIGRLRAFRDTLDDTIGIYGRSAKSRRCKRQRTRLPLQGRIRRRDAYRR